MGISKKVIGSGESTLENLEGNWEWGEPVKE